jgi:hypothetical protein
MALRRQSWRLSRQLITVNSLLHSSRTLKSGYGRPSDRLRSGADGAVAIGKRGGSTMGATKTRAVARTVARARQTARPSAGTKQRHLGDAEAATRYAWDAVKQAVRSSKVQPMTAARASGKAVRNVAISGARQTTIAAGTIARAADEVLMSAMSEARTAARAAREAANEVERSVRAALKAIRIAVRKRARVAVNQATRGRRAAAPKSVRTTRRRVTTSQETRGR